MKRMLVLALILSLSLIPTVAYGQEQVVKLEQSTIIKGSGLVRINVTLTVQNYGPPARLEQLNISYPGYYEFLQWHEKTGPGLLKVINDNGTLTFMLMGVELRGGKEEVVSLAFTLFRVVRYEEESYHMNYVVLPKVTGLEGLNEADTVLMLPRDVTLISRLQMEGFSEVAVGTWEYRAYGNETEPKMTDLSFNANFPFAFSNIEIDRLERTYILTDGKIKVHDKIWLTLYDDKELSSIRVADYIAASPIIRLKQGLSDFVYTSARPSVLSLDLPLVKGRNYLELEFELPYEGTAEGGKVHFKGTSSPPIEALIRYAKITVSPSDAKPLELYNVTSLPEEGFEAKGVMSQTLSTAILYAKIAALAAVFLAALYLLTRRKEEEHRKRLVEKKELVVEYFEAYSHMIRGLLLGAELEKERKELERRRNELNTELERLRKELIKDKKREEANKTLALSKEMDEIIRQVKLIYESYRTKKIKRKEALRRLKELFRKLEGLKLR
jgi:hypothetical protein